MSVSAARNSATAPATVIAGTVAGNALEFYDFLVYTIFTVYISKAFFPAETDFLSLLITVGAYADRAGRRAAMMLTIALVTIGTMGLALTPTYASIGAAAPTIVILCRIVQGFGLGGEVGPASAFLVEAAPPNKRGFYASWQIASQGLAVLVAGVLGFALSLVLTKDQLFDWGWRVPFLLCLALIPLAFYLRRAMPETLEQATTTVRGARDHLGAHVGIITLAVLVILGGTVSTYVGNYMTTYAIKTLNMAPSIALFATVLGGAGTTIGALTGGALADRYGRRSVMLIPRIVLAVLTWPAFWFLSTHPTAGSLFVATVFLTTLTGLSAGASLVIIPELLPRLVRATGLSIAYAIGVSIFGGTTQFIVTWLIGVTKDPTSPGWYVAATSLVTIAAILAVPETRGRELEG